MAREAFRYRGRFISPAAAANLANVFRERYESGQRGKRVSAERYQPPPPEPEPEPEPSGNWQDDAGVYTVVRRDREFTVQEGEVYYPLTPDAWASDEFPSGYASFQLRFMMPDNPDYPRGWASSIWLRSGEWNTVESIRRDFRRETGSDQIGAIIFSVYDVQR